jgi:hypothetical protein
LNEEQVNAYFKMKELCWSYVIVMVENKASHEKFMAADGLVRLLVARDYKVEKSFEMYKKWADWRI